MTKPSDFSNLDKPVEPSTNRLALISFLAGIGGWLAIIGGICPLSLFFTVGYSGVGCLSLSFIAWIGAIVTGDLARKKIAIHGEAGENLAVWGMLAGIFGLCAVVFLFILVKNSCCGYDLYPLWKGWQ